MSDRQAKDSGLAISIDDILRARERIAPYVSHTPVLTSPSLNQATGQSLFFKCENMQYTGAFKARGASNAVFSLDAETARRGVVTHSSGNHAAALAWAASLRGIPAAIVMPNNGAANKIAAVRRYGIEPTFCEPTFESRTETAQTILEQTGGELIHPFNDARVMAGQGTAALEFIEQAPSLDVIVVPVGGGGLLSGTLIAVKSLRPKIEVYAAEPARADDAFRGWKSGRIEQPLHSDTVADGLRTPLGDRTFPIIRQLVDDILLVQEETIIVATRELMTTAKIVAEPSGAAPLAAVMEHGERFKGRRVGLLISGGNLNIDRLPLDRGGQ